jgi:hypothetical protein
MHMKSLATCAAACAAFLVMVGPAAASPATGTAGPHGAWPGGGRAASRAVSAVPADYAPLGARLATATATVSGIVVDSYGNTVAGGQVQCDSRSGDRWFFASATTGSDGHYQVDNVLPSSDGRLIVFPNETTRFVQADGWPDARSYTRFIYPGRLSMQATRGGPWRDFSTVTVDMMTQGTICTNTVRTGDTTTTPVLGTLEALSGAYQGGAAYFFWDEGLEFSGSYTFPQGSASADTLVIDEADAQRAYCTAPYWYSGKPGSTVKLALQGFPSGWRNKVSGYSDDAEGSVFKDYGTVTSKGVATQTLSLKVPATAKPGYTYWFGLQHVDAAGDDCALYLEESFQACTMKASKSAIRKGTRIRVTGVVPTQGCWGDESGLKKKVTLYAKTGKAAAPTAWNPASKGWTKVGEVRTNGRGAYTTAWFKPRKTSTLIVRYPGDGWYYGAYTSPQTVTVK